MSAPHPIAAALALLVTACSTRAMGPPEIVVDRTACSHCGMFVSEPAYAAAYRVGSGEPRVFDDIGCMLDAVRRETASPLVVWVQDAAGGGWVNAEAAVFVSSAHIPTPMHGGVLAYADPAAATTAAAQHRGDVVPSFQALMTRKGDAR